MTSVIIVRSVVLFKRGAVKDKNVSGQLFIHSLMHSFIYAFIHAFIHSLHTCPPLDSPPWTHPILAVCIPDAYQMPVSKSCHTHLSNLRYTSPQAYVSSATTHQTNTFITELSHMLMRSYAVLHLLSLLQAVQASTGNPQHLDMSIATNTFPLWVYHVADTKRDLLQMQNVTCCCKCKVWPAATAGSKRFHRQETSG